MNGDRDPLAPARGIIVGFLVGIIFWIVLYLLYLIYRAVT